jgi:Transcriptional regulator of a riboflavin/FAD biosynthetic operon
MEEKRYLYTLLELARAGFIERTKPVTITQISSVINMTQQNLSRHLIILEKLGYINKILTENGVIITLTKKGRDFINEIYLSLKAMMEKEKEIIIKGKVFTGIGEGAYYVTRKYYMNQFKEKLGIKPYPGTLNIKLIEPKDRSFIESLPYIFIPGTKTKLRTYGWVKCFPAVMNGQVRCFAITLERTHYDSTVIEVISEVNLRKTLNLKDNDIVEIKLLKFNEQQNKTS